MGVRFQARFDQILRARKSLLCIGLDPDPMLLPKGLRRMSDRGALAKFLEGIVAATYPYAAAYKMQLGAYLAFGTDGIEALAKLPRRIGATRLRILDLKANDIANTMRLFHHGAFDRLGFDAVTVTPWLGWETLAPFAEDPDHGFFVVAHSSNPGAPDFQEIPTPRGPLWLAVIQEVRRMAQGNGNAGAVVGATYAEAIRLARQNLGNGVPILVPGVGAQGGQLSSVVRDGVDEHGRALLINASRSVLYASAGPDWKKAAGAEAKRMMEQINQLRSGLGTR
ncbi:MAG: orotidine-5'-phosphate decarboxylase [Thermoplasmata archaeon]|nr:orotidine-5'-phosphate decarboxylase [Thermoplasmata archaeon]